MNEAFGASDLALVARKCLSFPTQSNEPFSRHKEPCLARSVVCAR